MSKTDTVGYRFTDTGPFDVSVYPSASDSDHPGMIFVDHPFGQAQTYGPDDPDDFWAKDPDDIRDTVIRAYVNSIDWSDSDWEVAQAIVDDAEDLGVDLDGGDA